MQKICFIFGGGVSLNNLTEIQVKFLNSFSTIGINRSFEKYQTTYLYAMDYEFYQRTKNGEFSSIDNYSGIKYLLNPLTSQSLS